MDIIINEDCEIYYDRIIVGDKHYTTIGSTPVRRLVINGFAKCLTEWIYIVADEIIMPHTDCETMSVKCKNITIESTFYDGIVGHDDSIEINLTSKTMEDCSKYIYYVDAMYNICKPFHSEEDTIKQCIKTGKDCKCINGTNIYIEIDKSLDDMYFFIKDDELYMFSSPHDCYEHIIEMLPEFVNKIIKK